MSCGSGSIQYNIQQVRVYVCNSAHVIMCGMSYCVVRIYIVFCQSFLAADDSLLKIQPDIPVVEDLMVCDKGICLCTSFIPSSSFFLVCREEHFLWEEKNKGLVSIVCRFM